MSTFTHLHTHSHYSLLSALPKVSDLVKAAKENGMRALALTDSGNLYGAVNFYKTCTNHDIKPIIGVDFYVARRTRHDREPGIDNRRTRLVLLAENNTGYQNLITLVTRSYLEGFYYKPRIDRELMKEHGEGLIAIIPATDSRVARHAASGNTSAAIAELKIYKDAFSEGNVFLEVTHHPNVDGHQKKIEHIATLGRETGTPLVAGHDIYYLRSEDRPAWETLRSIQSSIGFREQNALTNDNADFSFPTETEMEERFRNLPEALENTGAIAERCNVTLTLGEWLFPNFPIPDNTTYDDELNRLVEAGIKRRDLENDKDARGRIEYELNVIRGKGYAPYFLIVGDLMRYAHQKNILSTIRGSVAGSMVTYVMGITTINPLEYNLPFERFLNPERPSPPDIDMDFADDRRDEVIAYATEKYGADKVAQIGTFGTLLARAAVRDTARALGYDYATGDRIAKIVPFGSQGFPMTLARALSEEPQLKRLYDTDEDATTIIDMARKIEGNARHISVHAAGVVISPIPLTDIVPVQLDTKDGNKLITQYDMHAVEDIGLLKFDFLGLKNLAVLADSLKRVKKLYDKDIDIEKIPLDDEKTYEMLASGKTAAVFQLGGAAMTRFLKELQPSSIHDLNAMVALYRPGPMKNIPHYIARKHGREPVEYLHPKMKKFLDKSYGLLVYQDDILSAALEISDYTWKTVDKLRKAIGKKIPAEMARQHEIFVQGCIEHSDMTQAEAEGLWNLFEPFQGYGFNKAHAACYGRVAYQTAYMKANYPVPYMAAVLTADSGNVEKVAEMIGECKRIHIEVLPPDINHSLGDFTVVVNEDGSVSNAIRFGLHSIKNVGEGVADAIIAERKMNGVFESLGDLLERVNHHALNKKSLESLIKCGALDTFAERGTLLANIDGLLSHSKNAASQPSDQESLFALMDDQTTLPGLTLEPAEPADESDVLVWEKELLGLYVSGHPLDRFRDKLTEYDWDIERAKEEIEPGNATTLLGVIEEAKVIRTKSGQRMAFMRASDFSGSIEVVIFPKLYETLAESITTSNCVQIRGVMSDRGGELSLLAERVKELK